MSDVIVSRADIKPIETTLSAFGLDPQKIKRETSFALSIINNSFTLSQCDISSIRTSIVNAANIGLTLNPEAQECALIARKDRQTNEYQCTLMPMYQGLANLAFRSGNIRTIQTVEVRENDRYEFNPAADMPVRHSFGFGERGKPIGYYTLIRYADGTHQVETMSMDDVLKIRDKSDGWQYAKRKGKEKEHPWFLWFTEMARKACLKRALKYVNKVGVDEGLIKAIEIDNADYRVPGWKINKANYLLNTSTYDDERKVEIERDLQYLTVDEIDELIGNLEMNQLPNHPGYNDQVGKRQTGKQVAEQVQNDRA